MEKKTIHEMTLAQLQDYALELHTEIDRLEADVTNRTNENSELRETNLALQDRNNKLFMQVEQQTSKADEAEAEEEIETCEDFATKNFKEIMNK